MVDLSIIIKIGGMGTLIYLIFGKCKELQTALSDRKVIKQADIKTLEEIEEKLNAKDRSQLNLVKLKPFYFQSLYQTIEIHSAQKNKFEPSDQKIAKKIQRNLSSQAHFFIKPKQTSPVKWFAKVQHPRLQNSKRYQMIEGFGSIKGDFLDIKRQFVPAKKLSGWQKLRNWFFEYYYEPSIFIEQLKPYSLFLGPVIGIMKYQINLMKEANIIAVCNFQDGKIIPTITATSKNQILNYYQNIIHQKYLKIGGLIIGTIFIGRLLWSDIKKALNAMKVRGNRLLKQYYKAVSPTEDKMCIICYTNSRNMIFFDCRHMIMCNECTQTYDSDVCPYCKMEIDDIKPVIGIP